MAPRKSDESVETVELVEEVVETAPEASPAVVEVEPVEAPAPTVASANPLRNQPVKRGAPNNTWTLYYGNMSFDCVTGVERDFPEEVYNYLKRSGNILAPNF